MRMRPGLLTVVCLCVSMAWLQNLGGQSRPQAAATGQIFNSRVQPFLAKNCFACHSEKVSTASLNLQAFTDQGSAEKKPEVWDKVRDKLVSGKMPPPGLPVPAKEDLAVVTTWID